MNNRTDFGPNAAGMPKNLIPDWLDHTANAQQDQSVKGGNTAACQDAGPAQAGNRVQSPTLPQTTPG